VDNYDVARARGWRRHLHRRPGTGFDVGETADFLAATCVELGWTVTTGLGGTGLVASLRRGAADRAIALRADMDGLPIQEDPGLSYTSEVPGVMHACGHDGHMAMTLGAAAVLAREGGFSGTVHLVFQPAEEPGHGAEAMLADGLFDRFPVEGVFGLHNLPGRPTGELHTRTGPVMAAEDNFTITVTGRGGHASTPQVVVDPLVTAAHLVVALQTVVSRSTDPTHAAVVSCTDLVTDGARNAIPGRVVITGDTRSFTDADSALIERRIRDLAAGIAAAHGARCEVAYTREFRPTVNDPACVAQAVQAAIATVGADRVDGDCAPMMGSEDFAALARAVPGCFTFLGTGVAPERGGIPLHSRDYDFNDDVLGVGIGFYLHLVRSVLAEDVRA
jgi:hippurate hydrolase